MVPQNAGLFIVTLSCSKVTVSPRVKQPDGRTSSKDLMARLHVTGSNMLTNLFSFFGQINIVKVFRPLRQCLSTKMCEPPEDCDFFVVILRGPF